MSKDTIQSISNIFLIILFLLSIYAPPLKTFFTSKAKISNSEKRELASLPVLEMKKRSIEEFPKKFEAYYNDHFGLRTSLIYWHNHIKVKWLQTSPVDIVMLGKKNWLYYTPDNVLDDLQGKIPFTAKQLDQWKNYFENKRDWLAERGINYLLVIVPNKHSIYPENIKDKYLSEKGKTRTDQLVEYITDHSEIEFVDLRGSLLREKINHRVYFPTDLHLNDKGAFIAYKEIIRKISEWFPQEKILGSSNISEFTKYTSDGELAVMLGLPDCYPAYRHIVKVHSPCSITHELILESAPKNFKETQTCENAALRGVVFMDSMGLRMMQFLSENFKRVHFIWRYFGYDVMQEILEKDQEQPDIVIEEVLERLFTNPLFEKALENIPPPKHSGLNF